MTAKSRARIGMIMLAAALALLAARWAAAEELRIGFIAPITGPFAQIGKDMVSGFEM